MEDYSEAALSNLVRMVECAREVCVALANETDATKAAFSDMAKLLDQVVATGNAILALPFDPSIRTADGSSIVGTGHYDGLLTYDESEAMKVFGLVEDDSD